MLRAGFYILLVLLTGPAWAGNFDYLPEQTDAQKEFRSAMNAGNYRQALTSWSPAHELSAFGQSANGQATLAYVLYQNGLPVTALDSLIRTTKPGKLHPQLLALWSTEMKNSPWIQKGWILTAGNGWQTVVNNAPVRLRIKNKNDIAAAFQKAGRLGADTNAKARLWWQIATQAPLIQEEDQALKALKLLRESGQTVIGKDLVASVYARVLYQRGELEAALKEFNSIPKSSSVWVESVEERAWAHMRQDNYDKALGEVTTLLSPALAPLVGPETYFLANLMALRVCDYPRLFKNSELFKKRHRERLGQMQELAQKGSHKDFTAVMDKFDQTGVSIESLGRLVEAVPRTTFRDATFVRAMETRRQILSELKRAGELSVPVLSRLTIGFKAKAEQYKQLASLRLKALAQAETKEYRTILNKLHIVEAEVIERLHLDDNLKGQRGKLAKVEDQGDVLVFPYTSDEVWFDELDNYKARVKDCPTLKGASL